MTTLVIPDIHNQIDRVQAILDNIECDKVVFTGDYFDSVGDGPLEARNTAFWLKKNVYNPNYTFLYGNHDVGYNPSFYSIRYWCSGNKKNKYEAINEVLNLTDWNHLKFISQSGKYTLNHAGIQPSLFSIRGKINLETINKTVDQAVVHLRANQIPPCLFEVDAYRGGDAICGGLIWNDWRNFVAIPGINQIVGHTKGGGTRTDNPQSLITPDSENYCIDTRLHHFGLIINDAFFIIPFKDIAHALLTLNTYKDGREVASTTFTQTDAGKFKPTYNQA